MPAYDDRLFSPPAPVVHATFRNSHTGTIQTEVLMLIDTGADVTLLPSRVAASLALPSSGTYELVAFDGRKSSLESADAEMVFLQRVFRGRFLLTEEQIGIVGRDILNHVRLLLDGPNLHWEHQSR